MKRTNPVHWIYDIAQNHGWTIKELHSQLLSAGITVSIPTLNAWRYEQRYPSRKMAERISRQRALLSNPKDSLEMLIKKIEIAEAQLSTIKQRLKEMNNG